MKKLILSFTGFIAATALFFNAATAQTDGSLDNTFNTLDNGSVVGANSTVNTTAIQSDGKIIIGGGFTSYNGTLRNYIARVNSDGTLDTSFNPGTGTNNTVETVAIQSDGKIIIGGWFTSYNGTTRNRIARLNADGTLDTSFNPGTGANNTVMTIALQSDGKIIIGGMFTSYNGTTRNRIARLNSDGTIDTSFNPGAGANLTVYATALQSDGKIIIGGQFTSYNGTTRNRIARLNSDGTLDTSFNPGTGTNNTVETVAIQSDGKIIIGGWFTSYNGIIRNYIARLNASGTLDTSFDPGTGANGIVYATAIQTDGKIIIGGTFTSYNGTTINRIARIDSVGALDTSFNPGTGANLTVYATALQSDGKIIIGGGFTSYNGTVRNYIARINSDGALDSSFNPYTGASSTINATAIQNGGKIIIGGSFTTFNDMPLSRIARLNSDGSVDTTFNSGTGADDLVDAVAIQSDGKIIIGGDFTSYNGTARNRIARINTDGTLDTSFNVGNGANNTVYTVAIQSDGKIIIGGDFTQYNGTSRNRIARLNTDGTLDTSFNPGTGANNTVETVALQSDGKIMIGGQFTSYNGTTINRIARINTDGTLDLSFNPGTGAGNNVWAIALQSDGRLIIGGDFISYNGTTINRIARINTDGTLDLSFNPGTGPASSPLTISIQTDGKIIIGGFFGVYNGTARSGIARIHPDGALDTSFNPGAGANNYLFASALQSDGNIIIGGSFTSYDNYGKNRICRVLSGSCGLSAAISKTDAYCNGVANGSAWVSVDAGGSPYSLLWSDGSTTDSILNIASGTYTYTITDSAGCEVMDGISLTQPSPLTFSVSATTSTCNTANGSASATGVQGGTSPYTYLWSDSAAQTTATATGFYSGTYTVTVTDSLNCPTVTATATVQNQGISTTTSSTSTPCNVANGTATVSGTGGNTPYSYLWSDPSAQTTATATGLLPGSYSVTVTDFKNCTTKVTSVTVQQIYLSLTTSSTIAFCNVANGTATVSVTGSNSPYSYLWSDSAAQTTATATGLYAGTYTVTVTDSIGCAMDSATVSVQNETVLINSSSTTGLCGGGTASVNPSGGATPYTYLWNDSSAQTTATASGLSNGNYSITVTESSGCQTIGSVSIFGQGVSFSGSPTNCVAWTQKADLTGSVRLGAVGFSIGTKGYIGTGYYYSGGAVYLNDFWEYNPANDAWTQKANFSGTARSYAVGFSLGNKGYIGTGYQQFAPNRKKDFWEYDPVTNAWVQKADFGGTERDFAVGFSIGNKGYIGTGYDGAHKKDLWEYDPATDSWQQKADLGGTARSGAVAFSIGSKGYIGTGAIPTSPYVVSDFWEWDQVGNSWTQKAGFTGVGRSIAVGFSIGTKGYIGTGNSSGSVRLGDFRQWDQTTNTWSAMPAFGGTTRRNAVGFSIGNKAYVGTGDPSAAVKDFWEFSYKPSVSSSATLIFCPGGSNGTATVAASAGATPYTYQWDSNAGSQTSVTATGLSQGSYSATVTDDNGCAIGSGCINVSTIPAIANSFDVTHVTCNGANNGFIDLTPTGGTSPYTYQWSTGATVQDIGNLAPGNYSVTVTDNNSCTKSSSVVIAQPNALTTFLLKSDVTCFGGSNGAITLAVTGGTTPYSFNWSNGDTIQNLTGLTAGTYSVIITDANGCTKFEGATITQPATGMNTSITAVNPSCSGTANGSVDLDVTGGTPNYTYLWNTGAITQDLTNIVGGTYIVTVTDANGCTKVDSATLVAAVNFTVTASKTDISCNGLCDGAASVSISGGTTPYTIAWNTTPTDSSATVMNLCAGTYTVNVSDANNCQSTPSVTIIEPAVITLSTAVENTVCGNSIGSIAVSATGGVSPYSFAWDNGQSDSAATGLSAGTYSFTMTDSSGCSKTGSGTVSVAVPQVEICLVTVDSSSTKNVVIWEKPATDYLDSFRVYREIPGLGFQHIGSVEYSELSKFVDSTQGINPNITSYRYKLSAKDTCGNESPLSQYHETMNLQIAQAVPQGQALDWNDYAGFAVSYYRIMRDSAGTDNWQALDSTSAGITQYNDTLALPDAKYIVEIIHPFGCTATKAENHNSSRSNIRGSVAPGNLPEADFSANVVNINTGGNVNFTDLTTNNPTSWSWIFAGGTPGTSAQQQPQNIVYNTAGCFEVKLTASNSNGTDSISKTCYINVSSPNSPPVADFMASVTSIQVGGSVDFLDLSVNNPTSWKWLFTGGAPSFSLAQNPTGVSYTTEGCFDVTLIATNSNGSDTMLKTCYIDVSSVGIRENSGNADILIHPNPNDGTFTIELNHLITSSAHHFITIYNMLGEVVYQSLVTGNRSPLTIDLGKASGVYYVQMILDNGVITKKVVVE